MQTKLFEKRDSFGNRMLAEQYPNGNRRISLELLKENRTRSIGYIDKEQKTLYVKRMRSKHLHVKTLSYGFNDAILRESDVEFVVISEDEGVYKVPSEVIFREGKYLFFKQTGFEKQVFLKLEIIQKYKHENTETVHPPD